MIGELTEVPAVEPEKPAEPAPAKVEEPPKEEPKVEEKKESASARFAALAKKEKGLVLKQQDMKAKEEALGKQREEYEAWKKARASAKSNPHEALEALGVTYEELTAFYLNDKKPTADLGVKAVEEKLEAYKREQAEERRKATEDEKAKLETAKAEALAAFNQECIDFVKTNAAEYELTSLNDASGLVMQVIEQHFARTQRVMAKKEAADLVERHFEELVEKATATKKWQARAKPQPSKEAEKRPDTAQPAQQHRTLSNGMTTSAQGYVSAHVEQDRIQRAMAALDRGK